MAVGNQKLNVTDDPSGIDHEFHFPFTWNGVLADDGTAEAIFEMPFALKVTDVQTGIRLTGTAGTHVITDVLDDGVSIHSTTGKIAVAAADSSLNKVGASGTGITAPVLNASLTTIASGSKVIVRLSSVGTFTIQPTDATVVIKGVRQQVKNPTA